jgi:hypothetical protein
MSSLPPTDPEPATEKDATGALVWALCAGLVAAYAFMKAPDAGGNQTFYTITGAVAVIVALVHAYSAWVAFQRKPPSAA